MAEDYYKDRVVLITGGAQGIGLGMAYTFAVAGAKVVIADADEEAGQEALQRLQSRSGRQCLYFAM